MGQLTKLQRRSWNPWGSWRGLKWRLLVLLLLHEPERFGKPWENFTLIQYLLFSIFIHCLGLYDILIIKICFWDFLFNILFASAGYIIWLHDLSRSLLDTTNRNQTRIVLNATIYLSSVRVTFYLKQAKIISMFNANYASMSLWPRYMISFIC